MYNVPRKIAWFFAAVMAALIALCWWLSLRIHAARHDLQTYELGRAAERARNPVITLYERGRPFCYDGEFHAVERTGKRAFRIKR